MYNKHKMYKGGPSYKPFSAFIFRVSILFLPIIFAVYGILVQVDVINSPHEVTNLELLLIVSLCSCLSIIQFALPSKSNFESALKLIAFHILIGVYLVFISGVSSPFVAFWLVLAVISYARFAELGLQLSIMGYISVVAVNIIYWKELNYAVITSELLSLIVIILTGLIIMSFSKSQKISRKELNISKAQESLHRDRTLTIVNNLSDAVLSTDMDGIIRVYNAASLNLLDTNNSLNGHHIDEVISLMDQNDAPVSLFKECKKLKTVIKRDDLNYTFSDGEEIRLEVTYSPIHSSFSRSKKGETHDGYIIIMRDITKAKSLEEERDEFISVISHELRTPLTIAEGTISNVQLMMSHPDITSEMLKDSINVAHDQVIFLANMVNDLSTLSRAERGVLADTEEIDVRELAHKLYDKYHSEAVKKQLQLDLDLSPILGKVKTSRLYLEELLQNFITNAIKYTKEGSVKIIINQKDDQIEFCIKDSGIGISKTDQDKIFDKFYRSEDYRTRETGGTGLGLYVASKLSKRIGAKIEVKSRLNHGSTFSFKLSKFSDK